MGACMSADEERNDPVDKKPKGSNKEPGPQPQESPKATRQSVKKAEKVADPAWHGTLDVEPAGQDDRQAEYDTLFANKGKQLKSSETSGWTIKQYENGIQTQEQEGTFMATFKDGTQYQSSKGQLVHTYKEVKDDKGEIIVPASKWVMHPSGTVQEVITVEDGDTVVQTAGDGTKTTQQPDGSMISECRPDLPGGCIEQRKDGTQIQTYGPDSDEGKLIDTITEYPDPCKVKIQINRDGTIISVHPTNDPPPDDHDREVFPYTENKDGTWQELGYPTWGPHKRELPEWAKEKLAEKKRKAEEEERKRQEEEERKRQEEERKRKEAEERKELDRQMKEAADEEAKKKLEEQRKKMLEAQAAAAKAAEEAEAERRRIMEQEEAERRIREKAAMDAEEQKRIRYEEATNWFYSLNYMQIKKWLRKNNVPKDEIMHCLGIYELRQLSIRYVGEDLLQSADPNFDALSL